MRVADVRRASPCLGLELELELESSESQELPVGADLAGHAASRKPGHTKSRVTKCEVPTANKSDTKCAHLSCICIGGLTCHIKSRCPPSWPCGSHVRTSRL
jgi:hypothetical protein